jgi:hypothetical protein
MPKHNSSPTAATTFGRAFATVSDADRRSIFIYLACLIALLAFGAPSGGLVTIAFSFILKNKLHLQAHELATFRLVAAIPLYLAWIFGLVRDSWNPFGMKDRGFIIFFGAISTLLYGVFAFIPVYYVTLLVAMMSLKVAFLFVSSAQNGLTSAIGQQNAMSGQISALWNVFIYLCGMSALLAGGILSNWLETMSAEHAIRTLFLIGSAIMATVAIYGLWKPSRVFDNVRDESINSSHPIKNLGVLATYWPVYPALLIWLLWNFQPGSDTALQYHLQNNLHATDAQWGEWGAIYSGSFIPAFLVFGIICRKFPLGKLLFWGTLAAAPQMVPLLFLHSVAWALLAAALEGLLGGVALAGYLALIIRSCPKGLQGTTLMMAGGLSTIAARFGDVLGTQLYDKYGGFAVCVAAMSICNILIIPVLLCVPRDLIATADGEMPG